MLREEKFRVEKIQGHGRGVVGVSLERWVGMPSWRPHEKDFNL
jgi:hypothetical protein